MALLHPSSIPFVVRFEPVIWRRVRPRLWGVRKFGTWDWRGCIYGEMRYRLHWYRWASTSSQENTPCLILAIPLDICRDILRNNWIPRNKGWVDTIRKSPNADDRSLVWRHFNRSWSSRYNHQKVDGVVAEGRALAQRTASWPVQIRQWKRGNQSREMELSGCMWLPSEGKFVPTVSARFKETRPNRGRTRYSYYMGNSQAFKNHGSNMNHSGIETCK